MRHEIHAGVQGEVQTFIGPARRARDADRLTRTIHAVLARITDAAGPAASIASAQSAPAFGDAAIESQADPSAVRTFSLDHVMHTAENRMTGIRGALDPVIASTGRDGRVLASRQHIADIDRACVVIIAVHRITDAEAGSAVIAARAHASVITGTCNRVPLAELESDADTLAARTPVVAEIKSHALAALTGVADAARPSIASDPIRHGARLAPSLFTEVDGAEVVIVTAGHSTRTLSADAEPAGQALRRIRAERRIRREGAASRGGVAAIVRAGIPIITGDQHSGACALRAMVSCGAGVAVIAHLVDGAVSAALRTAFIIRAGIAVIAIERIALALTSETFVREGAVIFVITPVHVGLKDAPTLRRAGVVRALVSIKALRLPARHADNAGAGISAGAEVAVIARGPILEIDEHAIARGHIAFGGEGAGVVIVRAGDRDPHAQAPHAAIIDGAGIAIVAGSAIGEWKKHAPLVHIAEIHRARVLVLAVDGRRAPTAAARLADGRAKWRARVPVITGHTQQHLMRTLGSDALVEGAGVVIVTALWAGGISFTPCRFPARLFAVVRGRGGLSAAPAA